jgi:hypothetical protein
MSIAIHNEILRADGKSSAAEQRVQQYYDDRSRKARRREDFLRELARRHAERWGLRAEVARQHIDAVSCTARRHDEVDAHQ